jgi:putative tryptophan/tyrosine transport system substrate-binding protein
MKNKQKTFMREQITALTLGALLFAHCLSAEAQQPAKIPRIGFLIASSPVTNAARVEAFRQGLRELGYVEGKSIVIEFRSAEGKFDRLSDLAAELVRLKVDVIVTSGPVPTRSSKKATNTIPIVIAQAGDPVGSGFVTSLARPGGNITGLSTLAPEISGKRLEFLKETVPKLLRVAVFGTSNYPSNEQSLKETELAAGALGLKLQYVDILAPKDIDRAFREASKGRADAVLVLTSPVFNSQRTQVVTLAAKSRIPTIYPQSLFVEEGGLMTYGVNVADLYRRAATYVDKILKGARPGDLPVEQPTKFEFVINLRTAKALGLTIPLLLGRADEVIE